jgi:hypothetical protein
MSPCGTRFSDLGILFDFWHTYFRNGPLILSPGPMKLLKVSQERPTQKDMFRGRYLQNGCPPDPGNFAIYLISATHGHVSMPSTTCTLHHVYTSSLHLSMVLSHEITPDPIEPRHFIFDFGQVILHMATLHYTTFLPHIRSIITSVFGRTMYQINTSL